MLLVVVKFSNSVEILHDYVVCDLSHTINQSVTVSHSLKTYPFDPYHAFATRLGLYKEVGVAAVLCLHEHQIGVATDLGLGNHLNLTNFVVPCHHHHARTLDVADESVAKRTAMVNGKGSSYLLTLRYQMCAPL